MLQLAKERGAQIIPGIEMFVHQAARQFEIWTGKPAPQDEDATGRDVIPAGTRREAGCHRGGEKEMSVSATAYSMKVAPLNTENFLSDASCHKKVAFSNETEVI